MGDLEQSEPSERSGWDLVRAVVGQGAPLLGEESDFIIQLETWCNHVDNGIFFAQLLRSVCSLSCSVYSIFLFRLGRRKFELKRRAASYAL